MLVLAKSIGSIPIKYDDISQIKLILASLHTLNKLKTVNPLFTVS